MNCTQCHGSGRRTRGTGYSRLRVTESTRIDGYPLAPCPSLDAQFSIRFLKPRYRVAMTLRTTLIAFLGILSVTAPVAIVAMPPASSWEIGPNIRGKNYSVGMPSQPEVLRGGGVSFEFPRANGEVDALTAAVGSLSGVTEITLRYRIDAARGTRFVSAETPDQTATVSFYFQRSGDNWSARGRYASYRWYVPVHAVVPLAPGERTVTVRLDEPWTNVNGVANSQDRRGFENALESAARLGISFGTASARSHGVYATGPARFTVLSVEMR